MLDNTRKTSHVIFFPLELLPFFLKNLCFQQPHRALKNSLISYTAMVRIACGPLQNDPWDLSHSIVLWEMSQNFCHCEDSSFFEMFVSIDRLGPEKLKLSLAQYLEKYLVDPF